MVKEGQLHEKDSRQSKFLQELYRLNSLVDYVRQRNTGQLITSIEYTPSTANCVTHRQNYYTLRPKNDHSERTPSASFRLSQFGVSNGG
jgi:hypothetical protein